MVDGIMKRFTACWLELATIGAPNICTCQLRCCTVPTVKWAILKGEVRWNVGKMNDYERQRVKNKRSYSTLHQKGNGHAINTEPHPPPRGLPYGRKCLAAGSSKTWMSLGRRWYYGCSISRSARLITARFGAWTAGMINVKHMQKYYLHAIDHTIMGLDKGDC